MEANSADHFDIPSLADMASKDPRGLAGILAERAFGDYVVVVRDKRGGSPVVFSDPVGGRPAFAWLRLGVTIIGDIPRDGMAAPVGVTIDWPGIRALMADARRMGSGPPLKGVTWIAPGICRHGPQLQFTETVWTPARAAPRGAAILKVCGARSTGQCARWIITIPSVAFKNSTSFYFRDRPYILRLPDVGGLYGHLDDISLYPPKSPSI